MPKRHRSLSALGLNLRRLREAKELTQERLGERAELDPTYISGIEPACQPRRNRNYPRMADSLVRCGWLSDYPTFRATPPETVVLSLRQFLTEFNPSQIRSWENSVPIAQRETNLVLEAIEGASEFSAVLEYELPRQGGRRPDVIALQNGIVVVIEFKEWAYATPEHVDQVQAYARDLKHYHELSHDLEVVPVLVPTRYREDAIQINNVWVLPPNRLGKFLIQHSRRNTGAVIDAQAWVMSAYAPLPSLVAAARMLFRKQELPRIKRAHSARLPEVVDLVLAVCHEAAATETRHVVFVTGAPGTGKTLVGLQVAHSEKLEDLRVQRGTGKRAGAAAVFLSGNGPLVEVLQDALGSKAFVEGMKKFIEYYGFKRPDLVPNEHVLIFDEAQRAWDADQMDRKHQQRISEPAALLGVAARIPGWSVVVALVGEGQEIHRGEEAGLDGWTAALAQTPPEIGLRVHGPASVESRLAGAVETFSRSDLLNLTTGLRSHVAADMHAWVAALLKSVGADVHDLRTLANRLRAEGFAFYATRDLEAAKRYVRGRYDGDEIARYGLVASRYAKNLKPIGIDNTYRFERAEQLKVGPWFNREASDPLSCCSLARPATEFECQGLELDFPIICWGDDLLWDRDRWAVPPRCRSTVKNPLKVTVNAYRVLLTRARDGMCLYVPTNPNPKFDATYNFLIAAGCVSL